MMAYFVDNWNEEDIQDIRNLLSKHTAPTEHGQLRNILKKVLSQVTQGMDMSPLFPDIVKLCAMVGIIEKKLTYLYMTTYAHEKPDLALLTVNTIQKDCCDANPMIRGLALKTLCSLRLVELIEYTKQPLLTGLKDQSAYVRRIAVLGCLKIHHINPQFTSDHTIINTLYEMLRDKDVIVITNCVMALEELLQEEGGVVINQKIAHYLINRLSEFTEWAQCCILQLLLKYKPQNEEEMFDLMNVLDIYLMHTNSGVCMAAIRLMLQLTQDLPDLIQDVYKHLKGPLVSLLSSDRHELVYTSLCHLQWLNVKAPGKLDKYYKRFFCRYNDPGYVKYKKVELLATLCTNESLKDIVEELSVYAIDISVVLSKVAIRALGQLAMRNSAFTWTCIQALCSLLCLELDSVSSEILVVSQDILRYDNLTDHITDVIAKLPVCEQVVQDPRGKTALVWLIAQHGQDLCDAPYILEGMIDSWEEEPSNSVKLSLLTTATKLFFSRPAECQDMLGKVLERCIESDDDPDLQEKALMYYRLLSQDTQKAKDIICTSQPLFQILPSDGTSLLSSDLQHFNSIALVFGAGKWQEIQHSKLSGEAWRYAQPPHPMTELKPDENEVCKPETSHQLLDLNWATTQVRPDMISQGVSEIKFAPTFSLSPEQFEEKWMLCKTSKKQQLPLLKSVVPNDFQGHLEGLGWKAMAITPEGSDPWKAFMYAKEANTDQLYLMEVNLYSENDNLTVNIKCQENQHQITSMVMQLVHDAVA